MRHNDVTHSLPLVCSIDHGRLKNFLGYSLKTSIENDEAEREEKDLARASDRKTQVGSGDRSERIRTYNYPQGRITDHRINLTLYKLDKALEGYLDELINALLSENQAARLAEIK